MPQGKLVSVEKVENGVKLTFIDLENNQVSGVYNNGNLSEEQLKQLIGEHISFSKDKENSESVNVHKAWKEETPTYCDNQYHAIDR